MNLLEKGRAIYKDHSREILLKVDSLFIMHFALIFTFILISIIYSITGKYERIPFSVILLVTLIISLRQAYRELYELSAILLCSSVFIFLAYMDIRATEYHPYAMYRTALFLAAPTMMCSLLVTKIRTVYIFAFVTVGAVVYCLIAKVIPGNPDLSMTEIIGEYFIFVLLLLVFIAHFVFKKHRITIRIINESDELSREAQKRAEQIRVLLEDVQKSIGITDGLLTEVNAIHNKVEDTNRTLNTFQNDMTQFSSGFKESALSLNEIGREIDGLNNIVTSQASAQEESAAATNQMVSSINNVAGIVEKKVLAAEGLINTTSLGGQKLEDTVTIIQAISGRVDAIMEMVELINSIASNTNLLSMNAAIEAAHAGEAGKGFAVVAEEIRKLAEESANNSESIAKVLKEVVDNIKQSYDSGVSTQEAYTHILSDVKETSSAFHEISATTSELNAGSREILISLTELTELTKSVKTGTKNISDSQILIEKQLSQTGSRISGIESDINRIVEGNDEIEAAIKNINRIAETLKQINESLKQ